MPCVKSLYRQLKAFSLLCDQTEGCRRAKTMMRVWAFALGTCAIVGGMGTARADIAVGAGFETFRWKESGTPSVKEKGLRWALDLTWTQSRAPGPSAEYNIKTYVGNV